jgi:F0F1-type ATP synthase assembly protein I
VDKREALSLALNLGWTMLFSLLIPLLAGIWLDRKLDTMPLLTLIGAMLGVMAATIGVARIAIRCFQPAASQEREQPEVNGEEEPK